MNYTTEKGFKTVGEEQVKINKDVNVMIATEDDSPVFLVADNHLYREGRIKFNLGQRCGDRVLSIIQHISDDKYELSMRIEYIEEPYMYMRYSYYTKMYTKWSLQNDYFIKEITRQTSSILNKEVITKYDFMDIEGTAEIVTDVSNEGVPYSKLENIKLYKVKEEKKLNIYPIKINSVLNKSYDELNKSDIGEIIKELKLDPTSSMYEYKIDEIESFCNKIEPVEHFLYRGKTLMKLMVDVESNSSSDEIYEYIQEKINYFDIKPRCILITPGECCLEYMSQPYFHFKHWSDCLKLKIDFIEHLESVDIEGVKLRYRMLDDLSCIRDINENLPALQNVKFTKELFNHEEIEYYGY